MNQYIYLNNNNFYKIIAGIDQHFRMLSLKQKGRSPGAIYSDSAGNQWLGKFAKDREDISGARQIIQEAFGYALYQTFKVDVPPWQLVKAVDKSAGETWWILTKWLSDFKTFEGELFSQMMLSKKPPITIKNMFRGLAIAKFFSEPDCLGGDGDNAGYIEKNEGPAFVKIDPANMFEFGWEQRLLGPELKNVAYNGGESMFNQTENVFLFELFSNKTQVEFLQTFREILDVEMATFSDIFESILPQPGIITNQLKHQLMGLIENRKKEINRLYFSQKPPSFDLITLEERSFSLDSLSHSLTQLESIVTFRKTKYNSEISRLPKFSQLWLLAETILYPKFQLAPNMPKNYPLYWLEVFNCMSEPYQLPNSPNAPITAYMCLSGEVILSFDNEDSHTKKVVFPGEVAMVNYKHQKVTVHPSKGVCMLIEMYNQ